MEYNDSLKAAAAKAAAQLDARINKDTTRIIDATETTLEKVQSAGGMNTSAIAPSEVAEFLDAETYKSHLGELVQITETEGRDGRIYQNLYAFATIYRKINGKLNKTGERMINVGGMLRRHFDMSSAKQDESGKWVGASRVVTPGKFNEDMQAYGNPWNILTGYLAGKKVEAKRSETKHFYQQFVSGRPVEGKFIEQNGLEYSFVR